MKVCDGCGETHASTIRLSIDERVPLWNADLCGNCRRVIQDAIAKSLNELNAKSQLPLS